MPRLSSQSKHEELESNSTLQIKIRREEGVEAEKEEKQRISHWCEISISCALFMFPAFDFLTPFFPFFCPSCISVN